MINKIIDIGNKLREARDYLEERSWSSDYPPGHQDEIQVGTNQLRVIEDIVEDVLYNDLKYKMPKVNLAEHYPDLKDYIRKMK